MKHVDRYALGVIAALALAGCGSQVAPTPMQRITALGSAPNLRQTSRVKHLSDLAGELFSGTVTEHCVHTFGGKRTDFQVAGTVSWPFSGSFTANGHASWNEDKYGHYILTETFEIVSTTTDITGTVRAGSDNYHPCKSFYYPSDSLEYHAKSLWKKR